MFNKNNLQDQIKHYTFALEKQQTSLTTNKNKSIMWTYKGFIIKPYVVIRNGYRYSITDPDGVTHIGSARSIKDVKQIINNMMNLNMN